MLAVLTEDASPPQADDDSAARDEDAPLDDDALLPAVDELSELVTEPGDEDREPIGDDPLLRDAPDGGQQAWSEDREAAEALAGFGPDCRQLGRVDPAAIFALDDLELSEGRYRITLVSTDGASTALSSGRAIAPIRRFDGPSAFKHRLPQMSTSRAVQPIWEEHSAIHEHGPLGSSRTALSVRPAGELPALTA